MRNIVQKSDVCINGFIERQWRAEAAFEGKVWQEFSQIDEIDQAIDKTGNDITIVHTIKDESLFS